MFAEVQSLVQRAAGSEFCELVSSKGSHVTWDGKVVTAALHDQRGMGKVPKAYWIMQKGLENRREGPC